MKLIESKNGFDIYFEALPEETPIQDSADFESDDQLKYVLSMIESGQQDYFCAHVMAYKNGVKLGEDYLGCCHYESIEEFYDTYHNGYFADMVDQAIDEANQTLSKICKPDNDAVLKAKQAIALDVSFWLALL